ncbi:MAG: hypothetical protein J6P60_02840 [Lachnospiraceae bacterium]|nr:hypothetical protein [Lachnospiraceae bacterium]
MNILEYGKPICYSGYRLGQSPKMVMPSKEGIKPESSECNWGLCYVDHTPKPVAKKADR